VAIANTLQLEAARCHAWRRSFSASITTPMPSLKSLNLSAAVCSVFTVDSLRYAVTLNIHVDKKMLSYRRETALQGVL